MWPGYIANILALMSSVITGGRVNVSLPAEQTFLAAAKFTRGGTHEHANSTLEQLVYEVENEAFTAGVVHIAMDVRALTKPNAVLRIYAKIDGVNYVRLGDGISIALTDESALLDAVGVSTSFKVTLQSQAPEGAVRSMSYRIVVL